MVQTQEKSFISALVTPTPGRGTSAKKSWAIDVETVWVPFFTATNAMGETNVSPEALGAPIRLATQKDGSVRFSSNGRPVMRVASELSAQVGVVKENFVASLTSYVGVVTEEHPDAYAEQVRVNQLAGTPLLLQDTNLLHDDMERRDMERRWLEAAEAEPISDGDADVEPATTSRKRAIVQPEVEPIAVSQ